MPELAVRRGVGVALYRLDVYVGFLLSLLGCAVLRSLLRMLSRVGGGGGARLAVKRVEAGGSCAGELLAEEQKIVGLRPVG